MDEDMSSLQEELEKWKNEAQSYRVVANSFERRVLDLQKELQSKDEEIEKLKEQLEKERVVAARRTAPTNQKVTASENGGGDNRSEKVGGEESEMFRKLFVGGLNNSTTEEHLTDHFGQYGTITSCKVMRDTNTNHSRGFAFIVFADTESIDEVQRHRPHHVDNRTVETKRAIPQGEAPTNKPAPVNNFSGSRKKVFVGGLKATTEAPVLHEYFSKFGEVECVNLLEDKVTHKKRGFAYIIFNDSDIVDKVILQKYHMIDGHRVEAKRARSVEEMSLVKVKGGASVPPDPRQWTGGMGPGAGYPGEPGGPWGGPVGLQGGLGGHQACPVGPQPARGGGGVDLMQLANLLGNFAQQQQAGGGYGGARNYGSWDGAGMDTGGWMTSGSHDYPMLSGLGVDGGQKGPQKMIKPRGGQRGPGPYGAGYGLGGNKME